LCYDYVSLVYKASDVGGLPFDTLHPQHLTHRQFVRKENKAIPTLLGRLLFLRTDSDDDVARNDYFCIISALFIPWSNEGLPRKPSNASWEDFFSCQKPFISARLLRHIDNIALLHKSRAEAHIDQLRLHALQDNEGNAALIGSHLEVFGADSDEEDDCFNFEGNESAITLAVVQSALQSSLQSEDRYVREAMDANFANGYFETTPESTLTARDIPSFRTHNECDGPNFMAIDPKSLGKLLKEAEKNEETRDYYQDQDREVIPGVFIKECDVNSLIRTFSLNVRQQLAFRCNHALGLHPPSEPQLLMGVFGEGGTGKSRLIDAIRTWFRWNGRETELVLTAGTAAVKIRGTTVHSAVSISIDDGDGKKGKMSVAQKRVWTERRYMVIDEVSMLNCKVIELLHRQLATAKANPELPFSGVNLIFLGDFLQLPAVRSSDVYVNDRQYRLGHQLWRSLNAVVILREQMRQAGDPLYAGILSRVRLRIPTDDDIEILRSRIGAHLPNTRSVPAVVR
jgi:hypothetical protein